MQSGHNDLRIVKRARHVSQRSLLTAAPRDAAIPRSAVMAHKIRAQCRHQATVVTISGEVDAVNGDRVHAFATRFVRISNALILDLSGVDFFAARGISVLFAVDDACCAAEVPWALVPSPVVGRVLH